MTMASRFGACSYAQHYQLCVHQHYVFPTSSYHFHQVIQGKATLDSIDAHSLFAYSSGSWLFEELAKVGAGFRFPRWCHGVLQVVCYAIDIEATRLIKELHRRTGNCVGVNWLLEVVSEDLRLHYRTTMPAE